MKFFRNSLILLLSLLLLLSGCKKDTVDRDDPNGTGAPVTVDFSANDGDMFTKRDLEQTYDTSTAVTVVFEGNSVSCSSSAVSISETTVTITSEGTYLLSGSSENGQVIVNAKETDKPQLVFNGLSLTCATSAPLYIVEADKVVVTLAEGSVNTLANGGSFVAVDENTIDGAVFSKQDLSFNGTGSLNVTSPVGHGIVCKDDLVFTGGSLTVNAASHALDANDSVRITGTTAELTAGKDGIHVENNDDTALGFFYLSGGTLNIDAQGDGISASSHAQIAEGTVQILAGGGSVNGASHSSGNYGGFMGGGGWPGGQPGSSSNSSFSDSDSTSMKGIKSAGSMLIAGGTITIDSADDAIHSNTSVVVNGGNFTIATGDDGFHADDSLSITAGTIDISKSYEGLEATNVTVSGGVITLVATDDGINAAGGTDSSGNGGRDNGMFGGGGFGGMGGTASSNGSIVISGGTTSITASGDGLDANGTLEITGGYTVVTGPTQGDTATLDYDISGVISGGTFIGTGASGMAQTFSDSKNQGVIAVSVGTQSAQTEIRIQDKDGNTLISSKPSLSFSVVIISSPDLKKGETYTVCVGNLSGEFEAE